MTGIESNPDYAEARHTTIDAFAEPDPLYVLELAEALAEIVRALNHLTMHHEAFEDTGQVREMLGFVVTAAERLPQLTGQAGLWVRAEAERGGIQIDSGTLAAVIQRLASAGEMSEAAGREVGWARSLLAELDVPGDAP